MIQKREIEHTNAQLNDLSKNFTDISKDKLAKLEKQFEKRKEYYHKFASRINQIKLELENLAHKIRLTQSAENPLCPLCEQDLPLKHKHTLHNTFEQQKLSYNHKLERLTKIVKDLKNIIVIQQNQIEQEKKQQEDQKIAQVKYQELKKSLTKAIEQKDNTSYLIENITKDLEVQKKELTLIEQEKIFCTEKYQKSLDQDVNYQELKQQILQLELQLQKSSYNAYRETEITQRLHAIAPIMQQQAVFLREVNLQEERKQGVSNLCKHIKQLKSDRAILDCDIKIYSENIKQEHELINREQKVSTLMYQIIKKKKS